MEKKLITELCARLDYKTPAEMSRASGVSPSTLSQVNRGRDANLGRFVKFILKHLPQPATPEIKTEWLQVEDAYRLISAEGLQVLPVTITITLRSPRVKPDWALRISPNMGCLDSTYLAPAGTKPEEVQRIALRLIRSELQNVLDKI